MKRIAILIFLLLSGYATAKVPADAWQTGTLKDASETWHSRTVGTLNGDSGLLVGRDYPIVRYAIETETYVYEAD